MRQLASRKGREGKGGIVRVLDTEELRVLHMMDLVPGFWGKLEL